MDVKKLLVVAFMLSFIPAVSSAQKEGIVLRPTPGEEIILAVADIQPASEEKAAELSEAIQTFNRVLWDDLSFSGFFTLAGKSFYPPQSAKAQSEKDIPFDSWAALPFKVSFLSTGTLALSNGSLIACLRIFDMKQRKQSFEQEIAGTADQVRVIAHKWADEIVYRLSGGASKGIASTKIAYTAGKGNAKEIYVMDYDGFDPQAFTRNGSLNLYPSWSSDNSKLAFLSQRTGQWEINIYSYTYGSRLTFPIFKTFTNTPSISPDGEHIAFSMRTSRGDIDLFISGLDGSDLRNITNNPAIDTSPTWSPSGRQIAFVSGRDGKGGQIYICDSDGANLRRLVKERGDADSPAWSPDGRYLAFHWKPHMGTYYDLFLAEVSTGRINQLTTDSGSNEFPSWAPDGRHIVFQSNRTGSDHLYIMLLDGRAEPRMITRQGNETGPAWGGYIRK